MRWKDWLTAGWALTAQREKMIETAQSMQSIPIHSFTHLVRVPYVRCLRQVIYREHVHSLQHMVIIVQWE